MLLRLVLASCVTLLAAGCGSDADEGEAQAAGTPGSTPSASETATTEPADPLEGRWETETVTREMVRRHLVDAGLARAVKTVLEEQAYPQSFVLTMAGSKYKLTTTRGDVYDDGSYEIQGDKVTFVAAATGVGPTFVWSLDGEDLDLEFVSSNGTPYMGLPDEAFARPIYDVPSFTRAS